MRIFLIFNFFIFSAFSQTNPESFVIQVKDRSFSVSSPVKKKSLFAVIVDNQSLSNQLVKFIVQNKILKFVNVKIGHSEVIELENKTNENVFFVPVSPSFQEAELIFGRKAYEIPSKE